MLGLAILLHDGSWLRTILLVIALALAGSIVFCSPNRFPTFTRRMPLPTNGWTSALAKGYLRRCDRWTFSTLVTNWRCGGMMAARVSSRWKGCGGAVPARAAMGGGTSWGTCTSGRKGD